MTTENYNIISENTESTVVACYERPPVVAEEWYQSEADLERDFIRRLQQQGYEYLPVKTEEELKANLRKQMETLNSYTFSNEEWERFFKQEIAASNVGVVEKTQTMQGKGMHIKSFVLDDGTPRNFMLINKKDVHANSTQVINQYVPEGGARENRYDVTILVNGLPMVHVELKRRGVSIKEAFNQINRYSRESFWAGLGLFEYVQLFVISNGTETKYYSNTTRAGHIKEQSRWTKGKANTSNSFEFTSYWADQQNKVINDLTDFTATFFTRHTLLNVLTRFCVFTEQKQLLAMRPYQIAATEKLLNKIDLAHNKRYYGSIEAGGYIWHTTGSGKTLTSFKAAQLVMQKDFIHKVFFVVDRKDLDYQTMKEYDRFQKGAANGNTSTRELVKQIESTDSKIIVTTIQKLSNFAHKFPKHDVYDKEVVIIFDECHRSQFGEMNAIITKRFKKYYLFGFTGTPIFTENITSGSGLVNTTEDVFGRRLHAYTIVDAIRDHNVLPFRVAYIRTIKEKEEVEDAKVWDIERDKALMAPERIHNITEYILKHFDQQTKRSERYKLNDKLVLSGFNSIFAVQSIDSAKLYYNEFKRQMAELPPHKRLKIATIFSYGANEELGDGYGEEDSDSTTGLDQSSRDFLDAAIADYNALFSTNFDTSSEKFPNYYKDVSMRMKNRDIDLLIVVNMFLTGFDATTMNTLWVDKNLRYHGLIQAFSRTNRILNAVKTYGNIVCFRNLEDATNKALSLFGDSSARGTAILRPFEDYFYGFEDMDGKHVNGYVDLIGLLRESTEPGVMPVGEEAEKEFIRLFGGVLRMTNLLSNFDQFAESKGRTLTDREEQDYKSIYISLAEKYRNREKHDKESINDDVEFEMELVKQVQVNIDYILFLVNQLQADRSEEGEIKVKVAKAVSSSPDLRDKKELIMQFIDSLTPGSPVDEEWKAYINGQKREEFQRIIKDENLKSAKAVEFIEMSFRRGYVPESGMELSGIMPNLHPFRRSDDRMGKTKRVLERLKAFFEKYYGIANGEFSE